MRLATLLTNAQELHYDGGVWYCVQYHGFDAFHREHLVLLYSGWTCWDGVGLVPREHVHLLRRLSDGRFG